MPSVMDNIRFRNRFSATKKAQRNQLITETIGWLESTVRPTVKPEHLSFLIDFENALQSQLNQETISETWYQQIWTTYNSFPFYEKFLGRMK
jgi:hypothetical protein